MFIRNIRKSDYKAVDNLLLQLHQQDVTSRPDLFSPTDHYMTKESFDNLVESRHVMTILAQQRMEILGCCFVSMLEKSGDAHIKTAYIDLLVVDEKHRRKGIGKALFNEVQRRARKVGAKRVNLTVWSYNKIAESAYESYGMTPLRSVYEIGIS